MKKHLILTTSIFSLTALLLTSCDKIHEPQPVKGGVNSKVGSLVAVSPAFNGTGSTTNELDNLTWDFARVSTSLTQIGSSTIIQHGHVWSEEVPSPYISTDPQQANFQTELGTVSEMAVTPYVFTSYVKNLAPATRYYVRAYVVNKEGTFYGPITQFQTKEKGYY